MLAQAHKPDAPAMWRVVKKYSRTEADFAAARSNRRIGVALKQAFLLGPFAGQLARAAHGLGLFTSPAL